MSEDMEAEIEAAKTPSGGWTREQLARWGVPWPPPKGWRQCLMVTPIPIPPKPAFTRKERT